MNECAPDVGGCDPDVSRFGSDVGGCDPDGGRCDPDVGGCERITII